LTLPDDWPAAIDELRAEGWQVDMTCQAAPAQLEGHVPGGAEFYFRAQHDHVSLAIGGEDPVAQGDWEAEVRFPDASWLSAEDGLPLLRHLFDAYRRSRGRDNHWGLDDVPADLRAMYRGHSLD
jgi:hypothetical protein